MQQGEEEKKELVKTILLCWGGVHNKELQDEGEEL